jgi:DNA-binding response OmpR family regulator
MRRGTLRANRDKGQVGVVSSATAASRPLVLILDRDVDYREELAPVLVLQEGPASRRGLEEAARAGAVACLSKEDMLPRAAAGFATSQLVALGRTPSRFRRSGDAVLDVAGRSLRVRDEKVPLTRMQAEILAVLLEPPADEWKPIPAIARKVFGVGAKESVVRKQVNRFRVKFTRARLGARIETAHARGYRLVATDWASS